MQKFIYGSPIVVTNKNT